MISIIWLLLSCSGKVKSDLMNETPEQREITKLLAQSAEQKDRYLQNQKAEALALDALEKSLILDDPAYIANSCNMILRSKPAGLFDEDSSKQYIKQAESNAEKVGDEQLLNTTYFTICKFLIDKNNPEGAQNFLNKIKTSKYDSSIEIKKLIILSKISKAKNQTLEELEKLLDAHYMALDAENDTLKNETLQLLFDFYFFDRKYEKAMEYNNLLKRSIESQKPVDSIKWYFAEINRLAILTQSVKNDAVKELAERISIYGKNHNNPRIKKEAQSQMRTYLINHGDFNGIRNWYAKYPDDLRELKLFNQSFYYRVLGFMAESEGKKDSARYYFNMPIAKEDQYPYFLYTHYLRLGDFEKRQQNFDAAQSNYEIAYENILKTNYFNDQIKLGDSIADYYRKHQQRDKSLFFLSQVNNSKTKFINVLNDENIRDLELGNVLARKELERQKEEQYVQRRNFSRYLVISLMIILAIMTMVVISLYKIPGWWLKSMGYLSFLMFFEFLFLLVETLLHNFIHGDPLKIILLRVTIIAALFPLHHWIEKTFVNLLLNQKIRNLFTKILKEFRLKTTNKIRGNINLNE